MPLRNPGGIIGTPTFGTSGSILFIDSSGNLAQSNANFFWDNTNKRLGIGTNSPSTKLSLIDGSAGSTFQTFTTFPSFSLRSDSYTAGYTFNIASSITVSRLGRFWFSGNTANHIVAIYRNDGTLITQGTVLNSATTEADGCKYVSITPVVLDPQYTYRIAAVEGGENWADLWNYNLATINKFVKITGSNYVAGALAFPSSDGVNGAYSAPTMTFTTASAPQLTTGYDANNYLQFFTSSNGTTTVLGNTNTNPIGFLSPVAVGKGGVNSGFAFDVAGSSQFIGDIPITTNAGNANSMTIGTAYLTGAIKTGIAARSNALVLGSRGLGILLGLDTGDPTTIGGNSTSLGQLTVYSKSATTKGLVVQQAASPSVNSVEIQNSAGTPKLTFGNQATTDCLIKWPNIALGAERVGLDFFCSGAFGSRIGIDSGNGDFLYQDTSAGPAGVTRFSIARATGALGISGTSILFGALVATTFSIKSNTYNGSTYIDAFAFQTFDNGSGQRTRLTITAGGTIANAVATVRVDKAQFLISSDRAQDVVPFISRASTSQTSDNLQIQDDTNANLFILDKKGRPITANTTPTIAAGTGAGTTPTVSIAGTDVNGVITVLTGTAPTLSATVATISYSTGYATAPKTVMLTPANTATSALNGAASVFVDSAGLSTTKFDITVGSTALAATTTYKWYYQVLG